MRTVIAVLAVLCAGCAALGMDGRPAGPGVVKITPLGSHDGEFCPLDRALVLDDPDGTRILYDAGRTVRGLDDPRLGKIDAVLLTHVHDDHLGGCRIERQDTLKSLEQRAPAVVCRNDDAHRHGIAMRRTARTRHRQRVSAASAAHDRR